MLHVVEIDALRFFVDMEIEFSFNRLRSPPIDIDVNWATNSAFCHVELK